MKKHMIALITIGTLALTATGCSCSKPATVTPGTTDPVITTEAPAPETTKAPETEAPTTAAPETSAAVRDVTISIETYKEEDGIKITYPVLSGLSDTSMQSKWNDLFFNDARSDAGYLVAGDSFTSSWEVVSGTARLISLVKTSVLTDADGNVQRAMKAYNIDSSTGQMKRLSQLSDINAIAQDLANVASTKDGVSNNAYILYDAEGHDVTATVSLNDLLAHYKGMITGAASKNVQSSLVRLFNQVDYIDNGQIAGYSFWKGGVLRIIFPYDAEISDYLILEVKDAHRNNTSK